MPNETPQAPLLVADACPFCGRHALRNNKDDFGYTYWIHESDPYCVLNGHIIRDIVAWNFRVKEKNGFTQYNPKDSGTFPTKQGLYLCLFPFYPFLVLCKWDMYREKFLNNVYENELNKYDLITIVPTHYMEYTINSNKGDQDERQKET